MSPLKGVTVMISESVVAQFSLIFPESEGAASASECTLHLFKVFR